MKILTVVGARPQFIKASVVSKAIQSAGEITEVLLHTGQHFDSSMSDIFFTQLGIPEPHIKLNIHGGLHGDMTGRMLMAIEKELINHEPDRVLVYGDTNSTLAGALAAAKLHIPVAHVEAGLRSFNMKMPEEINRILTDQISDLLFCPTEQAMKNLYSEGFNNRDAKFVKVGDVMQDSALMFSKYSKFPKHVDQDAKYILMTLHRAENTDDPLRLASIIDAINVLHSTLAPVVMPLHPRTKQAIARTGLELDCCTIDPVGYLEMLGLLQHTELVLTDSGGLQKEAFFFGKACITLRDQTEWTELLNIGANELVGSSKDEIIKSAMKHYGRPVTDESLLYGGGRAAVSIVEGLLGRELYS